MKTLTINIANDALVDKVMWLLEHFKNDGLEIVSREEETISFEKYLKNEN